MAKNSNGVTITESVPASSAPNLGLNLHLSDSRAHDALEIIFNGTGTVAETLEQIIRDLYDVPEGIGSSDQTLQPDWGVLKAGAVESNQYDYNSAVFTGRLHYADSLSGLTAKTGISADNNFLEAIYPRYDIPPTAVDSGATDANFNLSDGSYTGGGSGEGLEGAYRITGGTNNLKTSGIYPNSLSHAVISGTVLPADKGVLALVSFFIAPNADDQKYSLVLSPNLEERCVSAILLGGGIATGNDGETGNNLFKSGESFPGTKSGQYDLSEIHNGVDRLSSEAIVGGANEYAGLVRLFADPRSSDVESPIPILGATSVAFGGGDDSNFFRYRLPALTDYEGLSDTPTDHKDRFFDKPTLSLDSGVNFTFAGGYSNFADQDPLYSQLAKFRHRFEVSSDTVYVLFHFRTERAFESLVRDGNMPTSSDLYGLYAGVSSGSFEVTLPSSRPFALPLAKDVKKISSSLPSTANQDMGYILKPVERAYSASILPLIATYGDETYYSFWAQDGQANVMSLSGAKYIVSSSRLHPNDITGGAGDSEFKDYGNLSLVIEGSLNETSFYNFTFYDTVKTDWLNSRGQSPGFFSTGAFGLLGINTTPKSVSDLVSATETVDLPSSFDGSQLGTFKGDGETHGSHLIVEQGSLLSHTAEPTDVNTTFTNYKHLYLSSDGGAPVVSSDAKVKIGIHRHGDNVRVGEDTAIDLIELSHSDLPSFTINQSLVFSGKFKINSEIDPAAINYDVDTHYGNFLVLLTSSSRVADYTKPMLRTNISPIAEEEVYTLGAPLPSLFSAEKDSEERFLDETYRLQSSLTNDYGVQQGYQTLPFFLAIGQDLAERKLSLNSYAMSFNALTEEDPTFGRKPFYLPVRPFYSPADGEDPYSTYELLGLNYLLSQGSFEFKRPEAYPPVSYVTPGILDRVKVTLTDTNAKSLDPFYIHLGYDLDITASRLDSAGRVVVAYGELNGVEKPSTHATEDGSNKYMGLMFKSFLDAFNNYLVINHSSFEVSYPSGYETTVPGAYLYQKFQTALRPILNNFSHDPASANESGYFSATFEYQRRIDNDPFADAQEEGIAFFVADAIVPGDSMTVKFGVGVLTITAVAGAPNRATGEFQTHGANIENTVEDIIETLEELITTNSYPLKAVRGTDFLHDEPYMIALTSTDPSVAFLVNVTGTFVAGTGNFTDYLAGTSKTLYHFGTYAKADSTTALVTDPSFAWKKDWTQADHDLAAGTTGVEVGYTTPRTQLVDFAGSMGINFMSRVGFLANDSHIELPSDELQVAGLPNLNPHSTDMTCDPTLQRGRLIYPSEDLSSARPIRGFDYHNDLGAQPDYSSRTGLHSYVRAFDVGFTNTNSWIDYTTQQKSDYCPTFAQWYIDNINTSATLADIPNLTTQLPQERAFRIYGISLAELSSYGIFFKVPGQTAWLDATSTFTVSSDRNLMFDFIEDASTQNGTACLVDSAEGIEVLDRTNFPVRYVDLKVLLPGLFINPYILRRVGAKINFWGETPVLMKIEINENSKATGYVFEQTTSSVFDNVGIVGVKVLTSTTL
jgi:hypothetical protein